MKNLIMAVMVLVSGSVYGQGTGAFGSDCPTLAQQQAQYNASLNQTKANGIVVRDTASQQLQCYYQQLATYYQQLYKTLQQDAKTVQQLAKDKQQLDKDAQQVAADAAQKAKALELAAREAKLADCEEECHDMYTFCYELKLIIEKTGCTEHEVSEHVKLHINHSGQADGTNPGSTTQNNGGILNPSN